MRRNWMKVLVLLLVGLMLCGCEESKMDTSSAEGEDRTTEAITESVVSVTPETVENEATESRVTPASEFQYEMVNGEVIITGYKGVSREIYIPAEINDRQVTQIGEEAFSEYDLISIAIPDSVTQIHEAAFAYCRCLEKVMLSENLEIINDNAFLYCEALKEIVLPRSLQRITTGAFENSGLESVVLPEGLQYIGNNAFGDCENLKSLTIPDNVKLMIYTEEASNSMDGLGVYLIRFNSFVGASVSTQYFGSANGYTPEDKAFEKLPTVVVVKEGSYAHQQLQAYDQYDVIDYEAK